ncbi:hypothetical protein AB0M46_05490 [Dactylosporangium sp. NPDC051485]|uniref:hypothetical protein n=1 Tax=Dactylosporangium sp. NPDC051485 TaxID=3154846 RepID=UPI003436310C
MIERWFPCAEVSRHSTAGWGSGNAERNLFTWFAARPSAQAKAAVLCSLLPWSDDPQRQEYLRELVRKALSGRYAAWESIRDELHAEFGDDVNVLDPFSGRGMIPLEAARLGIKAAAVDYLYVPYLASSLLIDFPFRDWSGEPALPFKPAPFAHKAIEVRGERLVDDLETVFAEIGRRYRAAMEPVYNATGVDEYGDATFPWGYLWAVTLPCQECGSRFPLIGSYELRSPGHRKATRSRPAVDDPGQSFYVEPADNREFRVVVHDGRPRRTPSLANATTRDGKKIAGKSAVCIFCEHPHPLAVHRRLADAGLGEDSLLIVADLDPEYGKHFREADDTERERAAAATEALRKEPAFNPLLPAVPNERIGPGNNNIIGPSIYGARTYGDLMCDRQTLSFVRLARSINEVGAELMRCGVSLDYARAITGYSSAVLARKLRRATRGCTLDVSRGGVHDMFANQGSITFSYDFFEAGLGDGPGTWSSISASSLSTIRGLIEGIRGRPATVYRASATKLPLRDGTVHAVVTDPPYDEMIAYADSSDIMYAWLKRSLYSTWPEVGFTAASDGGQEKDEEIIVKRVRGEAPEEHRTRTHYDASLAAAFREMSRVVRADGLVTIVFGHGEPEVWQRLLAAIKQAGLVMTASWPANTESGSHQGKANIETTLTMACRPAAADRPAARRAAVEAEIRATIRQRYPEWERFGLAPTDMLMAAAGPAMEVAGRYSEVLDHLARPVDITTFLPLARTAVREAMAVEVDEYPLDAFDARSRFALWWVRLYGRGAVSKSELRWQALADSLELADVRDLVPDADKGVRFVSAAQHKHEVTPDSSVIDVVLAMAGAYPGGLDAVGEVLAAAGRETDDLYLWASMKFLANRLPASDADSLAWTALLRNRSGVGSAASRATSHRVAGQERRIQEDNQPTLF